MNGTTDEPGPRVPRALQVLLLLLGLQIAARVWPAGDVAADPQSPDVLANAEEALQGVWSDADATLVVSFDAGELSLNQSGHVRTVSYEIREVREDAITLELAHDPPVERVVCLFEDRIDLDCPTGIWLHREGA